MTKYGITDGSKRCECHKCIKDNGLVSESFDSTIDEIFKNLPLSATKMILCGYCGNKRCPKASDHRLDCTKSNLAGQDGSVYT